MTRPGENRVKTSISAERVKTPEVDELVSPENPEGFDTQEGKGGFDTHCVKTSDSGAATDPEGQEGFDTDTSAPHAREDGGPVEEGQTWGGPEGLEMFTVQVDGIQQGPVLPPESDALSDTNGSAPQDCR